jgi:poly-gamma-glutamate synthesis protein (capsule biosynthesis protein)
MSHRPGSSLRRRGEPGATPTPLAAGFLLLTALVALTLLTRSWAYDQPPLLTPTPYPWFYLRDEEPPGADEQLATVVAVGDVMLGRGVADAARPFAEVTPWLRAADLALGNLECVVGAPDPAFLDEHRDEGAIKLHAPPVAINELRRAGFDVLGLANNHALDLGVAALNETASRLRKVGIDTMGFGPGPVAAFHPLFREVEGVRLALLAFNAVPYPADVHDARTGWTLADWDPDRAVQAVTDAQRQADAVLVSVHWGYEYQTRVDPAQRDIARVLLDAGADLVVGHHPHVAQAFEIHDDRCVAYSLGNFAFDQAQGRTPEGVALRAFFDGEGLRAVQALPVQAGLRPRLMTPEEGASLLARVAPPPRRVAFACDEEACHAVEIAGEALERARAAPSLFWRGAIDLTGDGIAEHVRRVEERVVIRQDGAAVWRSPPSWRVLDVALGDPNDDGRGEVLLAFWRPADEAPRLPGTSVPRAGRSNQPFIVGYRGGSYRTLWGGSAVGDPIQEVALGDVNGDGAQDLIVLEQREGERGRTVAVWRWHGWGFSLLWRSAPGRYRELALVDAGQSPVITVAVEPAWRSAGALLK